MQTKSHLCWLRKVAVPSLNDIQISHAVFVQFSPAMNGFSNNQSNLVIESWIIIGTMVCKARPYP